MADQIFNDRGENSELSGGDDPSDVLQLLAGVAQSLAKVTEDLKEVVQDLKGDDTEQDLPMTPQDVVRSLTRQESLSVEVQERMQKRLEGDAVKLNSINDALIRGRN